MKGEKEMNNQFSVEPAGCREHQLLLGEYQRALEIWNQQRAEFCQFRFVQREAGDELLRLQANFARASNVFDSHERNCSLCQRASRIEGRDAKNSLDPLSGNETYT